MEKEKKIVRQYRIANSIEQELTSLSQETGKSKTMIIEEALLLYFKMSKQDEYEIIADKLLEKIQDQFAAYMTRTRLGLRTAEINSQVAIEILNTLLMLKGTKKEAFVSTNKVESPIITEARQSVKERIEKAKQKKDHAKT